MPVNKLIKLRTFFLVVVVVDDDESVRNTRL
jgi:hypothetical protein